MTKPLELYVTLIVPENLLSFCCSRHLMQLNSNFETEDFLEDIEDIEGLYVKNPMKYARSDGKYNLKQVDPQRLDYIIRMIKSATDAQLKPDDSGKNFDFQDQLDLFNAANLKKNKNAYQYKIEDIVRMIGLSNYEASQIVHEDAQGKAWKKANGKQSYDLWEFHEFEDIVLPGFSTNHDTKIYVKIATPMRRNPDKFNIVAVHHNDADKFRGLRKHKKKQKKTTP